VVFDVPLYVQAKRLSLQRWRGQVRAASRQYGLQADLHYQDAQETSADRPQASKVSA
jgi:hypothetical protein